MTSNCDLMKTIEDDQEVPDYSENSDEEDDVSLKPKLVSKRATCVKNIVFYFVEWSFFFVKLSFVSSTNIFFPNSVRQYQPRKQKKKESKDFDSSFQFTTAEHNLDPWNDLNKYIKRKPNTKLDDKIKKIRKEYSQVCVFICIVYLL